MVTATVPVRSRLTVLYQLPAVSITDDDVQRGYVDLTAATVVSLESNDGNGCLLIFEGLSWPFQEATVLGLASPVHISSPAALVFQPNSRAPSVLTLHYRIALSRGVNAGTYPWPFSISLGSLG